LEIGASCTAIFLYADDIILLAASVHVLQSLVKFCESELKFLDMTVNIFTLFHQMNGSTNKTYTGKHDNEQNTSSIYSSKH